MGRYLFLFLAVLLLAAVILGEDFVFILLYLLLGTYILSRLWGKRALGSISVVRSAPRRMFLGEQAQAHLEITNRSWFPVVWLQVMESLPVELASPYALRQVVTLPPKGRLRLEYPVEGRKRGYYSLGPLSLYSGDIFGVVDQRRRVVDADHLVVYPRIIPLVNVPLPSHSPLGTLRHTQPIFEDASRVIGKRDYKSGDSLRRVDWKSSAAVGRLLVKNYEPSIALETCIFLNLDVSEYSVKRRYDHTELAVVIAASLANWIIAQRQSVGLATNGADPLDVAGLSLLIPSRRGRGHLMRILDLLARVTAIESFPFVRLLQRHRVDLPWGATQIVVTPTAGDDLFDALFQARRSGLDSVLVLVGTQQSYRALQQRARYFGFPLYAFQDERDLDAWRN